MSVGQQSHALFYSIFEGHICRTFKTPTATSKPRVNKKGNTVHEEYYDYIDGVITDIQTRDHAEYGRFWLITLLDEGQTQVLQMNFSSGYSQAFLKLLPNVDMSTSVKIIPSVKKNDKGKDQSSVFITQKGTAIKWFWTKDNPGELPPLEKKKIKGKEQWDDSEQMDFLEKFVKDSVLPKIKKAPANQVGTNDKLAPYVDDTNEVYDDLPF